MPFTPEDGTGVAGANAYATVEEGDAYYEFHLYGTKWTDATAEQKQSAVVMASRLIDASFTFKGCQVGTTQGLKWPRIGVVLPSDYQGVETYTLGNENIEYTGYLELPANVIPQALKSAVLEMCRFLLTKDRSVDQDKSNVKRQKVKDIEREFFERSAPDLIPEEVQRLLSELTTSEPDKAIGKAGAATASRA